ncbi:hypothetical protein [Flavobacterium selenitireducens]|uniref:hypothetical protein n=1 Tax=Flavobacterium selenitireducens TaxID=2722704 RepID=UPI00168BAC87|nr:hypothetical protein [Flavobacterium selenitireducens]MBD3582198.1 hypothetical protein [Flavobacterium selenitireducens]
MYKILFAALCIVFVSNEPRSYFDSMPQDIDKIPWSSTKKLTWPDFQGVPDTARSNLAAMSTVVVEISDGHWEGDIPKFKIGTYFIKSKSWTTTNDNYTLNHEQVHFDLHELYARKIRKAFDSLNRKKVSEVPSYQKVYNRYLEEATARHYRYDSEANFNEIKQQQWSRQVQSDIQQTKQYEAQ